MAVRRASRARSAAAAGLVALVGLSTEGCGALEGTAGPSSSAPGSSPDGFKTGAPAGTGAASGAPATSPGAAATPPSVATSGTWARVETGSGHPAAREDHTWTVDSDEHDAWLFGGRDGATVFDDVWTFRVKEDSWERIEVTGDGPAARFGHEAAWVAGLGLVVFGGQAGSTFFDDLWLFEPSADRASGTWRLLPPGGGAPVARYGSCSGIGPDGRFWISHGFTSDGARFADTLAYDFTAQAWTDQAPATERPVERCLHACWWTSDGRLALYGGQTTGVAALGDLWLLTPGTGGAATNQWVETAKQEPDARHLPAIARRGDATFLFGGRGTDREALGETWLATDGAGFERFETDGNEPPARSGATLAYDPLGDRLLLFGGLGSEAKDDLWALTFP